MELQVINGKGVTVVDDMFAQPYNEALVHQIVVSYMNAARAGTKAQKTRAEVRGGGSKPWNQKGTGRARAGTIRSPLWRTGGKIFAAQPRDYTQKVNKKMYRGAMRSIVSELIRQERFKVVETFEVSAPKTKEVLAHLKALSIENGLIITDFASDNLLLAARNLYKIEVREARDIDPYSLIRHEQVVITTAALKQLEERLA